MLDLLGGAGLDLWVDGGWAVDALLGEQTRPHADLDLAIARADFDAALRLLTSREGHPIRVVPQDPTSANARR
ncbi:MAG: nucleotidyltransferase domain-containing protein [Acidimicrobiales bacterium]